MGVREGTGGDRLMACGVKMSYLGSMTRDTIEDRVLALIAQEKGDVFLREDFPDLGGYERVGRALLGKLPKKSWPNQVRSKRIGISFRRSLPWRAWIMAVQRRHSPAVLRFRRAGG
jgi:hypothetical protein